jgi:hypothetical protein
MSKEIVWLEYAISSDCVIGGKIQKGFRRKLIAIESGHAGLHKKYRKKDYTLAFKSPHTVILATKNFL